MTENTVSLKRLQLADALRGSSSLSSPPRDGWVRAVREALGMTQGQLAARLGIALLQEEGLASETLLAADLVFRNVMDLFACLKEPKRLAASLRS